MSETVICTTVYQTNIATSSASTNADTQQYSCDITSDLLTENFLELGAGKARNILFVISSSSFHLHPIISFLRVDR
jgi:hypothetical protein